MTDNNHPITPPPELVQQWIKECDNPEEPRWQEYEQRIATRAACWGADQQLQFDAEQINQAWQKGADMELEACCAVVDAATVVPLEAGQWLRAARRRPKPPSLKERALEILGYPKDFWSEDEVETIRRALESLPD